MNYSNEDNTKKRRINQSKKKKIKNKISTIVFRIFIALVLVGGFAVVGAGVGAYFGIVENAPKMEAMKIQPNIYTTIIYEEKSGKEIDRLKAEENREYVGFDKIPQDLKNAFVAIEDERFYSHNGIDMKGIFRAIYTNLSSDRKEGASTITQQLIKNTINITRNTYVTKIQEQYLAVQYEKDLKALYKSKKAAKDQILEIYLNTIGLHHGLNGVQTAANYYFDKDVSELTLSECAVIAAITQNPTKYAPDTKRDNNKVRQTMVLDKMLEQEMITKTQYTQAIADDVYSRISTSSQVAQEESTYHSYYDDALIQQVAEDLRVQKGISKQEAYRMLYNDGLKIYSAQDLDMQLIMDDAFKKDDYFPASDFEIDVQYYISINNSVTGKTEHYQRNGTVQSYEEVKDFTDSVKNELMGANDTIAAEKPIPIPQPQAAMVIMDYHTGQVKAITGGRGEKMANLALNRATDSPRQPGSVFKVLASYAPSIDLGVTTAATVIDDVPYTYGKWSPSNWYKGYDGLSSVRDGIRRSMNVITVKNMVDTGVDRCFDYLVNFGFTTLVESKEINGKIYSDKNPATALGGITNGVTQLEVTAAYGAIANLGEYNRPILYTKVLDHDNNVVLENIPSPRPVLKKQSAYILTDMMKDVLYASGGTGGKAKFLEINMPESGKTGTTTDTYDLTFVGYTPYYVAGIWLGFDYQKTMTEDKGYHMVLWRTIMEQIHKDLDVKDFERPDGIIPVSICRDSGKLPVSSLCGNDPRGGRIRTEIFASGTQPTEYCDVHASATIDESTQMKAGSYCPPELVKTVVGIIRPIPYTGDASIKDRQYEIYGSTINLPECIYHGPNAVETEVPSEQFYIDPIDGTLHTYAPSRDDTVPTMDDEPGYNTGNQGSSPTNILPATIPPTQRPPVTQRPIENPTMAPATPVPEYTETPTREPIPQTQPPNNSQPDLPVMDDPVSLDDFSY